MPSTQELNSHDAVTGQVDAGVPVIDGEALLGQQWDVLVPATLASLSRHGFLYVDLPPTAERRVQSTLDRAVEFFALPDEQKATVRDTGSESGWTPSFEEPAYQPGTVSNVESFDVEKSLLDRRDDPHWPAVPGFQHAVTDYWRGSMQVADNILELLARALNIAPRFLAERCQSGALNTLRLLHYPDGPPPSAPGEVGIAAHTDFECITLLVQTAPGLELRGVDGAWRDAPARGSRMVVLLGDMLERWTNGHLHATGHRVRRTPDRRYSLVMFIAVDAGIEVAPLPAFTAPDQPPRFAPVQQAAHIEAEMARSRAQAQATLAAQSRSRLRDRSSHQS